MIVLIVLLIVLFIVVFAVFSAWINSLRENAINVVELNDESIKIKADLIRVYVNGKHTMLYRSNDYYYSLDGYEFIPILGDIEVLEVVLIDCDYYLFEGTIDEEDLYYIDNGRLVDDLGNEFIPTVNASAFKGLVELG